MNRNLQTLIEDAKGLTLTEQLELIVVITRSLQDRYQLAGVSDGFWAEGEILAERPVRTFQDSKDWQADFWPLEDSVDEFNAAIRRQRYEDSLRE